MLKGKKGIFILIPLNIVIWSFFAYRFISLYNGDQEIVEISKVETLKNLERDDTTIYQLKLNYSDPFLKNEQRAKIKKITHGNSVTTDIKNTKPVKNNEVQKSMPEVKYLGLVKNSSTGSLTAIVSINGNSKLIKQNEIVDGIHFTQISSNSLTMLWSKEKVVINK